MKDIIKLLIVLLMSVLFSNTLKGQQEIDLSKVPDAVAEVFLEKLLLPEERDKLSFSNFWWTLPTEDVLDMLPGDGDIERDMIYLDYFTPNFNCFNINPKIMTIEQLKNLYRMCFIDTISFCYLYCKYGMDYIDDKQ